MKAIGFDVLIPDLPAARELRFFGSTHQGPAERLATLPIGQKGEPHGCQ